MAHPLDFIKMQAQALALPHYVLPIRAPYEKSYETSLYRLRDEMGINCVVTGDIAEVDGNPNWIRERSRPVGMSVHTPLWGRDRSGLLRQLLDRGFKARFSCVKTGWFNKSWIGRELNNSAIAELRVIHEQTGLDLCGEKGEYHTLVLLADSLPVPWLLHPARNGNRFSALVQTLSPKNYALEFKDSLAATNWTALSTNNGIGALRLLTDPESADTLAKLMTGENPCE